MKLNTTQELELMLPLQSVETIALDVETSLLARDLRTIMSGVSIVIRAGGLNFSIPLSQLPMVGAKAKASGNRT